MFRFLHSASINSYLQKVLCANLGGGFASLSFTSSYALIFKKQFIFDTLNGLSFWETFG